jgi:hypothetical protein
MYTKLFFHVDGNCKLFYCLDKEVADKYAEHMKSKIGTENVSIINKKQRRWIEIFDSNNISFCEKFILIGIRVDEFGFKVCDCYGTKNNYL